MGTLFSSAAILFYANAYNYPDNLSTNYKINNDFTRNWSLFVQCVSAVVLDQVLTNVFSVSVFPYIAQLL